MRSWPGPLSMSLRPWKTDLRSLASALCSIISWSSCTGGGWDQVWREKEMKTGVFREVRVRTNVRTSSMVCVSPAEAQPFPWMLSRIWSSSPTCVCMRVCVCVRERFHHTDF